MALFKKISPLEGNPCRSNGVAIEFKGLYYKTEDEADIEFLSGFKCYSQVDESELTENQETPKQPAKATTGVISASKLAGLAAQNK